MKKTLVRGVEYARGKVNEHRHTVVYTLDELSMVACMAFGVTFRRMIGRVLRGHAPRLEDFMVDGWEALGGIIAAVLHYGWANRVWRGKVENRPPWIERAIKSVVMGAGWGTFSGGGL